ncbi:zf-HC2 domain-containing protein [Streptomyces sp. LHD-70]|uniref:zf-HC2 domain-containing protein n=1 Tax=Streptomyces sp. LHD-70 TaxID=3072140 RepID=UPI00280E0468|nr:zf-HC2 domain-containing protein [Streptomyces sp. LHD-70]MDQ8702293.1 zf-HC2 domain-containing protein [Streptomyces sp. LHD-70]
MSGSRRNPAERHLAEQHLGDRLAALVDGELGHDSRERVLAHLATCAKCKAEADAQRSLKSYFASTAPPPPSDSFLARLQGLPAGGDDDRGDFSGPVTDPLFGMRADGVFGRGGNLFGYDPSGAHGGMLPGDALPGGPLSEGPLAEGPLADGPLPDGPLSDGPLSERALPDASPERGFRIHDVGRSLQERAAASRGRRFAFAAAGAVSLAAIALGGVSAGAPVPADPSADPRGSKASPMRTQGANGNSARDTQRRRGSHPAGALPGSRPGALSAPMAATGVAAPQVPGVPLAPHRPRALQDWLASPMLTGSSALSPLIRRPASGFPQYPAQPKAKKQGERSGSSADSAEPTQSTASTALPSAAPGSGAALSSGR